jgi:thioredoxin 1
VLPSQKEAKDHGKAAFFGRNVNRLSFYYITLKNNCLVMAFEFTDTNFGEKATQGVALVDFWAEWCGPCRAVAPVIEELASDYKDTVLVGKLDVDTNPEVSMKFGIRSIPTILILKDGEVVYKHVGTSAKQTLAAELEKALETA